jgi:3-phenylpropionate/trans-cinnamate dioxygenase ferredoxin subunit
VEKEYHRLCAVGDIEDNRTIEVNVNGKSILVTRVDGEYYAVENICTHESMPIGTGPIHDGQIQCTRHGARFDLKTGNATQLPAVMGVKTYKVKIENDDVLAAI